MFRYTFLLLAFFLTISAHASGINHSMSAASINPNISPINNKIGIENLKDARKRTSTKTTSAHSAAELANIKESTSNVQGSSNNSNLNNDLQTDTHNSLTTSSANVTSCKTYEGSIYEQGDAGYNDCIKTIKNDRQSTKTIP